MRFPNAISLKEIAALFATSLLPAILLAAPAFLFGNPKEGLWSFLLIAKISLGIALFCGLPAIYILNRQGLRNWASYAAVGIIVALGLCAYFILPNVRANGIGSGGAAYAAQITILMVLSVAVCTVYWLIVRPDKGR